jgi:hypothetical protein
MIVKPVGVRIIESSHLLKTMAGNQFGQIYHEHFLYFAVVTPEKIFAAYCVRILDVEELWTHGSLHVYACYAGNATRPSLPSVWELTRLEREAGSHRFETYADFAGRFARSSASC